MVKNYWDPEPQSDRIILLKRRSPSLKYGQAYNGLSAEIKRLLDGFFIPYDMDLLTGSDTGNNHASKGILSRIFGSKTSDTSTPTQEYINATIMGGRSANLEEIVCDGSKKQVPKVVVNDQEFALNVKGCGYSIKTVESFMSPAYKKNINDLITRNGSARVICSARDDFDRPYGGQAKEYAEQELRLSELKLLGVNLPPVFYICEADSASLIPASEDHKSSDVVMQEIRGLPSRVRLERYKADTGVMTLSNCAKSIEKIEKKETFFKNLFNSLFMIASMPARSSAGSIYYLPYGNVARDSAVSVDGTLYFVDLEEIECENIDWDSVMNNVRKQLKSAFPLAYKNALELSGLERKDLVRLVKDESDVVDDKVNKELRGRFYCAVKRLIPE